MNHFWNTVRDFKDAKNAFVASSGLGYPWTPWVRLLVLTGCRRSEIAGCQWSWINLAAGTLEIAPARAKSRRAHVVPLAPLAVETLVACPRFGGDFVLTTTVGRRPISGFSKTKARLDALAGVTEWCWHDLRRTCRTGLSKLSVDPDTAARVLGHALLGLRGTYDKFDYLAPKRDALERWADHVGELVGERPSGTVVPLEPRR